MDGPVITFESIDRIGLPAELHACGNRLDARGHNLLPVETVTGYGYRIYHARRQGGTDQCGGNHH